MTWKEAMDLTQLQQAVRDTCIIDGHKILFVWHNEQVYAMQSQCPHLKLPLAKGKITERCTIICPFHHSEFNLATGEPACWSPWPPGIGAVLGKISKPKRLKLYPTRVEEGKVSVDIN